MKKKTTLREIIKNMGIRSLVALTVVFLLAVAVTCAGGYRFYQATKEGVYLRGRVNAVQSSKEFDNYLLVRKNTVILAAHVVDEMLKSGLPQSEIMEYLTAESLSIKKSIDKDYTGLYGWINEQYCDGVGWIPDEDYVPTERPWYTETMSDDREVTFVKPYLDDQTKTVLTTMAMRLSDGVSVIALDVTLSRIQEITKEIAEQTPGSYGIVLDRTGQVIAHSDDKELGKNYLSERGTLGAALAAKLYGGYGNEYELSFDDQKFMVFVERIEGDWLSLSLINTRVFFRPLVIILSLMALFTVLEAIVFIVISRNFSERNLAIASAEAAQSASRAKSQFLSRMSHEIRTPINAIIGLDSIALRHEDISPRTREELNKIGSSARHLLSIINDILDMSRIESGKMTLNEAEFSFEDFLEEVNVIMNGQCDDKGLRYVCSKEGALDARFVGDSLKLKQVVINILGNAVKFTDPPGEVSFSIKQTNLDEDRAVLYFAIKDSGIGMDKEFIPKLFEAFSQEDMGNTTRFGGSGLGMAITKSIVEMMGGEIKVDSEKGVGTTFTDSVGLKRCGKDKKCDAAEAARAVPQGSATAAGGLVPQSGGGASGTMPQGSSTVAGGYISETGSAAEGEGERDSVAGMHVLIVEDQELNAEVLTDLLELEEVSSEWAKNGQLAVEAFEQNEPGHFDAILMDMRMPVMDGLEATRAIRNLDRPDAKTIPIIALSANAFEEDVRLCLEAGMNRHLAKPVDLDLLKEALRKC